MNDKIQKIHETEILGKAFQVYGTFEEPFFLAKDVAEWIEYSKTGKGTYDVSRMVDTVDDDEKLVRTLFLSGQNRAVTLLTENGLYEVLFQSRKPIAKTFKRRFTAPRNSEKKSKLSTFGRNFSPCAATKRALVSQW